jgi:hypothetical protein
MPIRWAYLKRVLAGAIFGLYMAHLLYFLNPQIDITPLRLGLVTFTYGLICGVLFGTALWGLRVIRVRLFGKPDGDGEYKAHGFGFVVLAAFISALTYWIHLSILRAGYLPIGAIRILAKATNLITATAFALLLLWFVERNADRRTSRALFVIGVVLIAISSFFLYQRRENYRTEKRSVVVANVGTVAGKRHAIVVAIRNLPYDWIVTMNGEGLLPFFERASRESFFTRIEPFPTSSPKALWASLATGKLPYRHGVTGRFSYRTPLNRGQDERFLLLPGGVGFQGWGLIPPVTRISAQLPAGDALPLWTLFERLGLTAEVIGWPSSAAGGASRVITDKDLQNIARPSALPPTVAGRFAGSGTARDEILKGLAADVAALDALSESSAADARIVALEGFAQAQRALHIYLNELPERNTPKGDAVRAYAQQIDRLLADVARRNPEHLLVICSPSAVVPPELPSNVVAFAATFGREQEGTADGFVLLRGPGVVHRPNPGGAKVTDIVPTVLFAVGLPVGRDMDGRTMSGAFADEFLRETTLSAIQTYEAEQLVVRRRGA